MPDFLVADHGAIVCLVPLSDAAHRWLDEHVVSEPWQWHGGALAIDPRCAADLVPAIIAAGFSISN